MNRKLSPAKPTPRPTSAAPAGDEDGATFEEALERLETIVEELEAGSLSLDQSLARYEEGMRLSRRLTRTLDQAEKRIERLVEEGGEPTTRPFEQGAGEPGAGERAAVGDLEGNEQYAGDPAAGERSSRGRGRNDRSSGGEGELPF